MKYIRLRAWFTILIIIVGVFLLLYFSSSSSGSFQSDTPVTDSLLKASYPDLYTVIQKRDAEQLKPFLSHKHDGVRAQAWRALANTPVEDDSLSEYIALAKEQNTGVAWFGISQHALKDEHFQILEQDWEEHPKQRAGIARVFGQQGNQQTLTFLLDRYDDVDAKTEYHYALAVGRLIEAYAAGGENRQIRVIQHAFDTENYDATKAFLYGWYRGDEARLSNTAQDTLYKRWQLMGTGMSRDVDQFVNKILPARTTYEMTIFYNGEQMLDSEVQLAYELATSIGKISFNDNNLLAAKILLTNENPHVQSRTLQSLQGRLKEDGDLYSYVRDEILTDDNVAHEVWLQAVQDVQSVDVDIVNEYKERLQAIGEENPYLWPQVLAVYEKVESPDNYLDRIDQLVAGDDTRSAMYALQGLSDASSGLEWTQNQVDSIRNIVFEALALGDRGVHYMAAPLLEDENLFSSDDFNQINSSLSAFSLPEDIEVYQAFGSLYKQQFEKQAKPVIDSLASLNYVPLSQSLASAGWDDVTVPEESQAEFRSIDWERLWELGMEPTMRLVTEKGRIDIELNTLSAPATVAMLDSLSRSGAYEDVPFHRVVPNFVIQGGDIERQDGFGGPDFVIPTEASDKEFVRGAVGIASAGSDTEGSQYFVMHQWMPHLNGNYTRFGQVIDGMKIVDRITVGDKVLSVSWR
ncbi:peptidylprolyl isomerase [Fodinibius sp. Rm-B-1B1-1]|uniref:peptidylprolyl isomerase n=1 Tax=Fodinibius alkaliphilus TaxID=3140241 RepID=UPI00315A605B